MSLLIIFIAAHKEIVVQI